jgi:hypothetical protein
MSSDWPLGEGVRVPARPAPVRGRGRSLPRAAWLLAGGAFLLGALVSAAAFAVGWHRQAQASSSTQAALATATAHNHRLAASLAAARAQTGTARAQAAAARHAEASASAAARRVSREAATLATSLVSTGRSADSVGLGAATLGSGLDRLAGELRTLTAYLSATPTAQLDPGYVAAQTAYLSKQLDRLRAARGDLAGAVAAFDSGAKALADRAAALAGRD